jgi:hypothetical protein
MFNLKRSAHRLERSVRHFGSLKIDPIGIAVRINLYGCFLRNLGPFQGLSFLIPRGVVSSSPCQYSSADAGHVQGSKLE